MVVIGASILDLFLTATQGEMFPHLYNGLRIGRDEVDSVAEWKKECADWDHVVDKAKEEKWLVY